MSDSDVLETASPAVRNRLDADRALSGGRQALLSRLRSSF
jgi:hypothetical protein